MPLYEFRCRTCDETFELRRSMGEANNPATCPQGHDGAVRLLSVFANHGGGPSTGSAPNIPTPRVGGGCGGGCACAH